MAKAVFVLSIPHTCIEIFQLPCYSSAQHYSFKGIINLVNNLFELKPFIKKKKKIGKEGGGGVTVRTRTYALSVTKYRKQRQRNSRHQVHKKFMAM